MRLQQKGVVPRSYANSSKVSLRRFGASRKSRAAMAVLERRITLSRPTDMRILASVLFLLLFS
jgi:hypothetical protein